jgi:hypothetical protein
MAGSGVLLREFWQPSFEHSEELAMVRDIAARLLGHLNSPGSLAGIAAANLPRASSRSIQQVFEAFAAELGFVDESPGLFRDYGLRPDYFLPLASAGTGILIEVERGKTTINNMDLLDFWKCHLCAHAHYLFLLVPRALRQNDRMSPRNEFQAVCRRLASFFEPRNHTNVRGLFVFGY